jgi:hypothetical protein
MSGNSHGGICKQVGSGKEFAEKGLLVISGIAFQVGFT